MNLLFQYHHCAHNVFRLGIYLDKIANKINEMHRKVKSECFHDNLIVIDTYVENCEDFNPTVSVSDFVLILW